MVPSAGTVSRRLTSFSASHRHSQSTGFARRACSGGQRLIDQTGGRDMPSLRMIAALAVLAAATLPTTAQNWPTRQVTMVFPAAAGGAGDILGRIFASRLSEL